MKGIGRVPPAGPPSARAPEEPGEGGRLFTAHVRRLAEGRGDDRRAFEELWPAFRAALRSELRKRGLWEGPPAYLGIFGKEAWEEPAAARAAGACDALDELLCDCYTYVFLDRLRSLTAQLAVKDNVDGLVFLNIRHFLHERQREHDPLGFRVFDVLRGAVQAALEAGELHLLAGDPRVRNDTRLGFAAGASPDEAPGPEQIRAAAARWSCDLLPELVTARGRDEGEVIGRLRALLPELRAGGAAAFSFKELVDPLKAAVRERWAALLAPDDPAAPGGGESVPSRPDLLAEGREAFHKLVACVHEALDRLEAAEGTRRYLATLWQFLRVWASYGQSEAGAEAGAPAGAGKAAPADPSSDLPPEAAADAAGDELPSQRRLSELLRIPRERLPALFGTLGRILARCRAAGGWKTAVTDQDESTTQRTSRGGAA